MSRIKAIQTLTQAVGGAISSAISRGGTRLKTAAQSRAAQRTATVARRGAGAAAVIGTGAFVINELLEDEGDGLDEVQLTSKNKSVPASTVQKSELGIIKFPLDLEENTVPHVLFKIYETQTGAVERTDITTQSFVSGVEKAAQLVGDNRLDELAGGVAGAILGAKAGGLVFVATGSAAAGATTAGLLGASGVALVNSGLAEDILEFGADKLGNAFGIQNTSGRFKDAISSFALKRNIEQLSLAIALLMPETLAVSYQNNYDALPFTEAIGGVGMATQALGSKLGGAGDAANPYIMEAAGRLAGQTISDDFKRIGLFATTGRTLNPQPEVIYNSPSLREFTMDFRLVPRNATEAAQIQILIQQLKFFASPQIPRETGGRYFIPPAQFELEFYDAENNQNSFLFRTKKCVLEDITVDYTGNGSFATFWDGSPIETRLTLRFKETVFIDREAIEQGF